MMNKSSMRRNYILKDAIFNIGIIQLIKYLSNHFKNPKFFTKKETTPIVFHITWK